MKKSNLITTLILAGNLLLQLSTLAMQSHAAAGDVDLTFNPGSSVNGKVKCVALQPDGKVIIAGTFTAVKGLIRTNLARLNADGSGDSSFNFVNAAAYLPAHTMTLQPDGKLLVAPEEGGLLRLNSDGSWDYSFAPSLTFWWDGDNQYEAWVLSMALQPDGKVVIGGWFLLESGAYGIARLNTNGSFDTGFNPNQWYAGGVESIALQSDGKVLARGYGGLVRYHANGSTDNTFAAAGGGQGSLVVQPDGKVLVGANGITRVNTNGSLDNTFSASITNGSGPGWVRSITVEPDGKMLIGGDFDTVNGTNRNRIARLNANGTLDGSFDPGTGANGSVYSVVSQSDGNLVIGGEFTTVKGVLRSSVARLYGDSAAPLPSLRIARSNNFVIVSWPSPSTGFTLQQNTNGIATTNWSNIPTTPTDNGATKTVIMNPTTGGRFFRLQSQ